MKNEVTGHEAGIIFRAFRDAYGDHPEQVVPLVIALFGERPFSSDVQMTYEDILPACYAYEATAPDSRGGNLVG